jgi:cytochrome c556
MKQHYLLTIYLPIIFLVFITNKVAHAEDKQKNETTEALELQTIMSDLGKQMQKITDGISKEDWALVRESAINIADHPQPPLSEKIKILSFVGTNISTFKAYDTKTHNAAIILSKSAIEKDGNKIITNFSILQKTCLACHQQFRQLFREHFYPSPQIKQNKLLEE